MMDGIVKVCVAVVEKSSAELRWENFMHEGREELRQERILASDRE